VTLRRGFKAEAEREAARVRKELGMASHDRLDPRDLATHLGNPGRQNSDIAHELAHVMLSHDLSEIREVDGMPFRTCNPEEEEEATAFGGTLLLPRPLLLSTARRRATADQIAQQYEVTVEMARFRYNTTGVAKQVGR